MVRELKNGFISVLQRHIYVAKCKWNRFNKTDRYPIRENASDRCKQALSGAVQKGQCMTSKYRENDKRADVDPTPPPGSLFCCEGLLVVPAIICFMGIL